jgi:hypothetical protein
VANVPAKWLVSSNHCIPTAIWYTVAPPSWASSSCRRRSAIQHWQYRRHRSGQQPRHLAAAAQSQPGPPPHRARHVDPRHPAYDAEDHPRARIRWAGRPAPAQDQPARRYPGQRGSPRAQSRNSWPGSTLTAPPGPAESTQVPSGSAARPPRLHRTPPARPSIDRRAVATAWSITIPSPVRPRPCTVPINAHPFQTVFRLT